jgi:adenosylhomocysteine nucleosidase
MHTKTLGILCGFEAEAAVARRLSPRIACSGAVEELAFQRAEKLVADGATALLSFGVAGGMAAHIQVDSLVIPAKIYGAENREWVCDSSLTQWLRRAAPHAVADNVYGSQILVPEPAAKQILHATTGCGIVDMESHVVAEVATRHQLPFAVLRGVSDTVEHIFPPAALKGLNPDGSTNLKAVLLSLARNPAQLPDLLHLFKHTGIALKALHGCVDRLK